VQTESYIPDFEDSAVDFSDDVYADHHAGLRAKMLPEQILPGLRSKISKMLVDEVHHVASKTRLACAGAVVGVSRAAYSFARSEKEEGGGGAKWDDEFVLRTLRVVAGA
jgi:hypothetical protein